VNGKTKTELLDRLLAETISSVTPTLGATGRPISLSGAGNMSSLTADNAKQYSDNQKLAARARINSKYTVAEIGWFPWVAKQLPLQAGHRVLDTGCGPGWFWAASVGKWPEGLDLILADLSPGMVHEAVERCRVLPFRAVQGHQADASALPFEDRSFDAGLPCTCSTMCRILRKALRRCSGP
jgi:ubiquinone/menaquinone biosynthesis C-methylase UbiE